MDPSKMSHEKIMKHFEGVRKVFGAEKHKAIEIFDDAPCYPKEELAELVKLCRAIEMESDIVKRDVMIADFAVKRSEIRPLPDAPQRIYLWPEGRMPKITEYTDNSDYKYNHDPDFKPYMIEILLPENVKPKGAVVVVPGGDHGDCTLMEGFQVCLDLNAAGYQCFLLHNRVNHNPWVGQECGVDAARAIRYVRANAEKYRIDENRVAFAGFSNGGLTGEACIQYYSGEQTVADHFPGYEADELDGYCGAPDAFLCIYGPRFKDGPFDYTRVKYPPVFFAVGREDSAMQNLNYVYPDLIAHGVDVEVHTFAGTPHGVAGVRAIEGKVNYPCFELWVTLADAFMQDVYHKNR